MSHSSFRVGGPTTLEADAVIIGSGAGGMTVAETLTAQGFSVVILEEGPYVPLSAAPANLCDAMPTMWRNAGLTSTLGKPPISYAEGRCVGGGTEINSGIVQRAPPSIWNDWQTRYNLKEFDETTLDCHYTWAEEKIGASHQTYVNKATDKLRSGADQLGWSHITVPRAQDPHRVDEPGRGRRTMTETLLPNVIQRGSRLVAECKVQRLLLRHGRVTGIKAQARDIFGKQQRIVIRGRWYFLCAGAIHTPTILQKSGIRFNVGNHLVLHPTIKLTAFFDEEIDAQRHQLALTAVTEFMPSIRIGGSIVSQGTFGMALAEDWSNLSQYHNYLRHTAIYYAMIKPEGSGRVRAVPAINDPIVTYTLLKRDIRNLLFGMDRMIELLLSIGATRLAPSIRGQDSITDGTGPTAFAESSISQSDLNIMTVHLFGTCPMGENRRLCATDSYGRVPEIENFTIADTSQIPDSPGVNPQATVMALAKHHALFAASKIRKEI